MGLTKNYLRFCHEASFNIVAASQAGGSIKFLHIRDSKDRFVAVPANENVLFWDLKTKQVINKLNYDADNAAEVTVLACHHGGHSRTNLIAVGYANGHIRLFEYETGLLKTTFTGHRSAVTALAFDESGSRLASGGKDCHIVIWDIVAEKGLYSLKGHKNTITKLAFLFNEEHQKDLLVTSSSDAASSIKFWDLQVQHCFCTLSGQSSGIWSFLLLRGGTRLITGSSSPELKIYSIAFLSEHEKRTLEEAEKALVGVGDEHPDGSSEIEYGLQIKHIGNILRNSSAISNRVQDLVVDNDESLIICHSIDKNIEFYGMRSRDEALSYAKKRVKKASRKTSKRKLLGDGGEDEITEVAPKPPTSLESLEPQELVECEFNRKLGFRKLEDKIKSLAVEKIANKNGSIYYKIATMTSSNKVDCYTYMPNDKAVDDVNFIGSIESVSHREDVRAVTISSDNVLILSVSKESAKVWRLESRSCIATINIDHATCCAFANAQHISKNYRNRFALVGTKKGCIQVIDIAAAKVVETIKVCDEDKSLNSFCLLPDQTGIVCGGEDGIARIYIYDWQTLEDGDQEQLSMTLKADRSLTFQEGITSVCVSSNNNLLAVALLDSTVRVHFVDTFKYFLTMYGHKFPVTTMDISDDNTLLITGSPDKNVKIWGLDFGDCHKSIFAHEDAITCVKFVPKTHHMFSCGRDRQIKQWDCDHFIKIQTLRKHMAEVWCMGMSPNGKYLVTGSHDKSIRLYRRTEEILVPSEEDETERELADERNVYEQQENIVVGEVGLETGFAAKMTIETVKSTDRLIEAIDVFGSEQEKEREYKNQCELAESRGDPRPVEYEKDPLLMTMLTTDYKRFMLEILRRIKSSELEEILLTLPFDYVRKLLIILVIFLEMKWDVELMIRCATFLLRVNFGQIAACPPLSPVIYQLKKIIMERSNHLRECAGFNLIALEHLSQNRKYQSTKVSRALLY